MSANQPVIIVAEFRTFPGREAEFASSVEALMEKMKTHRGVYFHSLQQDASDPCAFVFYEQYESAEALDAHASSEEVRQWRETLPGMAVRLSLRKFEMRCFFRTISPLQ